MSSKPFVLLNPASAAGLTGRHQGEILARITRVLGPVDCEVTHGAGDAAAIAARVAASDVERLLVAGGDGTVSETVAGILSAADSSPARSLGSPGPAIGLLPLGSGLDIARTLGLPRDLEAVLAIIARGQTRRIDAVRLEYASGDARVNTHFVNEASVGLSAETVLKVGRDAKRVGAKVGFVMGAVSAILSHRAIGMRVEIDGERVHEGPTSLVVAANGCYFGAGMKVAPGARIDDGLLEVVIVRGLSVPKLIWNLPSMMRGRHGLHQAVSFYAARQVEIAPLNGNAPIDVDGESPGRAPFRAEVRPGAIEVFAEQVAS